MCAPTIQPYNRIFVTSFIKTYQGYITLSNIMSGWQPTSSVTPSSWEKKPSDACRNWKPAHPHMPVRKLIITKPHAPTVMEGRPIKIPDIEKGKLFNSLPLDIIIGIGSWMIVLKYNDIHKAVVLRIKSTGNIVLCTLAFKYYKPYHNFGHLYIYSTN